MQTSPLFPRRLRQASVHYRPRLEALEDRSLPSYTITGLGTLGGIISIATGIRSGRIVGYSFTPSGNQHAFVYSNGFMSDLGTLGGSNSQAFAVSRTAVVGWSQTPSGARHAFLFQNGTMTDLAPGQSFSEAFGLNGGRVVGDSLNAGGNDDPFLRRGNGTTIDLGALGGSFGQAWGVNGSGEVVGLSATVGGSQTHAFHWQKGNMTDLGTLGGSTSVAFAINQAGQIVGGADIDSGGSDVQHAFLYQNNAMTDLGTLGGSVSQARAINQLGQVVGQSQIDAQGHFHAFLFDGQMIDLQNEVAGTGWTVVNAVGITNGGVIAGTGVDPGGTTEAFVMRPKTPTGPLANDDPDEDTAPVVASPPFSGVAAVSSGPSLVHDTRPSLVSASWLPAAGMRDPNAPDESGARALAQAQADAWFVDAGKREPFRDA